MQLNRFLLLPIFTFTLLSCSMDYGDTAVTDKLGDNIPDNVINNFLYTSVDNNHIVFRLFSENAENYSQKKETILHNVVFREYNSNNEILTEGTAQKGIIHTESDDAELTGSLIIYSTNNEAEIKTEYLYWDDSEKTLTGSKNGTVKLLKNSGTEISGTGFSGDLKTRTFRFEKNVKGIYHYEKN